MAQIKFSKNKKLNGVLNEIADELLELGINEIIRYKNEFKNESDYNIAQYGNLLVYYDDIYGLYREYGYKTTDKYSTERIWELYKRQVGYVARKIIREYK